ncbi:hypothetical protein WMY93_005453 [Mugilogobius chulae]|uniref:Uncharacterized protein n=1 Tax=Mugilogobius chulae TaxID=88201 RepID=A0AAW0PW85_9GOBI
MTCTRVPRHMTCTRVPSSHDLYQESPRHMTCTRSLLVTVPSSHDLYQESPRHMTCTRVPRHMTCTGVPSSHDLSSLLVTDLYQESLVNDLRPLVHPVQPRHMTSQNHTPVIPKDFTRSNNSQGLKQREMGGSKRGGSGPRNQGPPRSIPGHWNSV